MKLHAVWQLILCISLVTCSGCAKTVPRIEPEKLPDYVQSLGHNPTKQMILVDSKNQTLCLLKDNKIEKTYVISTGKRGLGQQIKSLKTPQGLHRINQKIGDTVPKYGIFNKRQYVGAVWKKVPIAKHRKDFISTRIMRLEGLQDGFNRGRDWLGRVVDSEKRAIYIHGTTMEWKLGMPATKGCVHMSADDVISLFKEVPEGTLVWIN